jgi:kynurenine formamidase
MSRLVDLSVPVAPDKGWAHDQIKLSTHGTTHLDAPWDYAPTSARVVAILDD